MKTKKKYVKICWQCNKMFNLMCVINLTYRSRINYANSTILCNKI